MRPALHSGSAHQQVISTVVWPCSICTRVADVLPKCRDIIIMAWGQKAGGVEDLVKRLIDPKLKSLCVMRQRKLDTTVGHRTSKS